MTFTLDNLSKEDMNFLDRYRCANIERKIRSYKSKPAPYEPPARIDPPVEPPMTCVTFLLIVMTRTRSISGGKGWFWAAGGGQDAQATMKKTRTVSLGKGWFWAAIKAEDAKGRPPPWLMSTAGSISPLSSAWPPPPPFQLGLLRHS